MMSPSDHRSFEDERDYLLDMIRQLAKLARSAGESEVEILLRATLDVAQASTHRHLGQVASAATGRRHEG